MSAPVFVNQKSDLTLSKRVLESGGFTTYRTRTTCNCEAPYNTRNAVIAMQEDHHLFVKVIRCRGCVQKGGQP